MLLRWLSAPKLKSAKAASNQAKRSGNTLWMSVADGMLAQSYDVQGQSLDARKAWEDATQYARMWNCEYSLFFSSRRT